MARIAVVAGDITQAQAGDLVASITASDAGVPGLVTVVPLGTSKVIFGFPLFVVDDSRDLDKITDEVLQVIKSRRLVGRITTPMRMRMHQLKPTGVAVLDPVKDEMAPVEDLDIVVFSDRASVGGLLDVLIGE